MTIAISAAAALAAIASAAVALRSLRQAKAANQQAKVANELPAIIDLFAEYRSPEMVRARRLVHAKLSARPDPVAVHELPEYLGEAATRVGHYLDHLGVLVDLGLLEIDIVSKFIARSAEQMWDDLWPYIEKERENRDRKLYLNFFESLKKKVDPSLQEVARGN